MSVSGPAEASLAISPPVASSLAAEPPAAEPPAATAELSALATPELSAPAAPEPSAPAEAPLARYLAGFPAALRVGPGDATPRQRCGWRVQGRELGAP